MKLLLLLGLVLQVACYCNVDTPLYFGEGSVAYPITFEFGGYSRTYFKYVPASVLAADTAVPVVVDLHGLGWCAEMMDYTGFRLKADAYGFVLLWPQGLFGEQLDGFDDKESCWAAGRCCGSCVASGVDDVAFLRTVVGRESGAYNTSYTIDENRVYFTGHSNGCKMAQRMNADAADIVAAVACFAGFLMDEPEGWYQPRSVMVVHGTKDLVVSYQETSYWYGAEENQANWATIHGCPDQEPEVQRMDDYILHEIECNGVVSAVVEVGGVGHTPYWSEFWHYDRSEVAFMGLTVAPGLAQFDTTQLAWDFLQQWTLTAVPPFPPSLPPSPPKPPSPPRPPPQPPSTPFTRLQTLREVLNFLKMAN